MYNPNSITHKNKSQFIALIHEYFAEGEHMDDVHFWDNFHDGMQIAVDFNRFIADKIKPQLTIHDMNDCVGKPSVYC